MVAIATMMNNMDIINSYFVLGAFFAGAFTSSYRAKTNSPEFFTEVLIALFWLFLWPIGIVASFIPSSKD